MDGLVIESLGGGVLLKYKSTSCPCLILFGSFMPVKESNLVDRCAGVCLNTNEVAESLMVSNDNTEPTLIHGELIDGFGIGKTYKVWHIRFFATHARANYQADG